MGNYKGHAHVRGSGYNSVNRGCTLCTHAESEHFGRCTKCGCGGFCARKLGRKERQIMRELENQPRETGVKVGEEMYIKDIREEILKRHIPGVDD